MWIGNMVENNKAVVHKSKRPPKMKFKMKTNLKQQQQPCSCKDCCLKQRWMNKPYTNSQLNIKKNKIKQEEEDRYWKKKEI